MVFRGVLVLCLTPGRTAEGTVATTASSKKRKLDRLNSIVERVVVVRDSGMGRREAWNDRTLGYTSTSLCLSLLLVVDVQAFEACAARDKKFGDACSLADQATTEVQVQVDKSSSVL